MTEAQELLQKIFEYRDGSLYWREPIGRRVVIGTLAGGPGPRGSYWRVSVFGQRYLRHHLVWCFFKGYLPEHLDHKDGDTSNDRIGNLREVNMSQNQANGSNSGNAKGYEKHGRWYRVRLGGKAGPRIEVGKFHTEIEAKAAYINAHKEHYGEHSIFNREVGG